MKIEAVPNRGMLGKRDRFHPWKAVDASRSVTLAVGKTKAEVMAKAMASLLEAHEWTGREPLVSTLSDGSIFVAQQTGPKTYCLWRFAGGRKYPSMEGGTLGGAYKDLKAYLDFACVDYERAIAPPTERNPAAMMIGAFD